MRVAEAVNTTSAVGSLLRDWRGIRRMSQLALAAEAEVSARHLSFVETGRAEPSREMVLTLARALDVPLRERNAMLAAAGYAPIYRETSLDDPEMAEMRRALGILLRQNEPFFAVALDRRWDILMCNEAYARFLALLGDEGGRVEPYRVLSAPRPNSLKLLFGPCRALVANWEEVATCALDRAQREVTLDRDPVRRRVLEECLRVAPEGWRRRPAEMPARLVTPVHLASRDLTARLFCTISTLGTAQDITLQELRIETFHAADEESERAVRTFVRKDDDVAGK
jgi:transcriptional regulator with XRE-family HTH domain